MSIVFTGGGTAGSLKGLLAVAREVGKLLPHVKQHFIAPKKSIGRELVLKEGLSWHEITAGKLHRFVTFQNVLTPYHLLKGYREARHLIRMIQPRVVITSGSFVSPPVALATQRLGSSLVVIQLDISTGLANKMMIPLADRLFVTFVEQTERYKNALLSGAPVYVPLKLPAVFEFDEPKPIVFIVGGGTGAQALNELVWDALDELTEFTNVVHIVGKGKGRPISNPSYKQYDFIADEYHTWLSQSSIVVSRAGIGSLSELSYYGKVSILFPLPDTHQEVNAQYALSHNAVRVLHHKETTAQRFVSEVRTLITDMRLREQLSSGISALMYHDAHIRIAHEIQTLYASRS